MEILCQTPRKTHAMHRVRPDPKMFVLDSKCLAPFPIIYFSLVLWLLKKKRRINWGFFQILIWFEYKYYLILFVIHGLLPEINIFFRVIRLFYNIIISIIYTNTDPVSISIQKKAPVCVTKSST